MLPALIITALLCIGIALAIYLRNRKNNAVERLRALANSSINQDVADFNTRNAGALAAAANHVDLSLVNNRFGRAGYLTEQEQLKAKQTLLLAVGLAVAGAAALGFAKFGPLGAAVALVVGTYLGVIGALYFLRFRAKDFQREVSFQMPLTLESLILLVESGLGILPAIQSLVSSGQSNKKNGASGPQQQSVTRSSKNPVTRFLGVVYDLAAHGMPLGQALSLVADATDQRIIRHVLLHLDISGTEGGELIPSLRNLSGHAHTEWRLSVENRVRRLENLVVFPVFVSVIGLMLLTAAVPMVPVLKIRDSMTNGTSIVPQPGAGADSH